MPTTTPRLNSLTSLRYLAALAVVVTHVNWRYVTWHPLFLATAYGYVGVSFFFVLSGFVLTWSCSRQPATRFWWNRFARIWPMQAAMMIIAYVFFWDRELHPSGPLGWILQPFLLQSWHPAANVHSGGDGPVWSLSCEMFFYALFPLVILAVRGLGARGLATAGVAVIAVMAVIPLAVGPHVSSDTYVWLFFYLPGYRFGEFLIGMLLARAVTLGLRFRHPSAGYLLGWAAVAAWGLWATAQAVHGHAVARPFAALTAVPGFAILLIAGASADLSGRSRLMSSRLGVWLGEWSFALYLVHDVAARFVGKHNLLANNGGAGGLADLFIFIAASTCLAAVAHFVIEKPLERRLRQLMRQRDRARPAVLSETPGADRVATIRSG